MIAVLAAGSTVLVVTTIGRAEHERSVIEASIDAAGSRQLRLTTQNDVDSIGAAQVKALRSCSCFESVTAWSAPVPVLTALRDESTESVPAWSVAAPLAAAVRLVAGRAPRAGEALISRSAMRHFGFATPVGAVEQADGEVYPVVGEFAPASSFHDFGGGVVIAAGANQTFASVREVLRASTDVGRAETFSLSVVAPDDPGSVTASSPAVLAGLQRGISSTLSGSSRRLVLAVLVVIALFGFAVVQSDILLRRSDLGRRRALGASRSAIAVFVVLKTAVATVVGVVVGLCIGVAVSAATSQAPTIGVLGAVATTVIAICLAATIAPACVAASADPLRVLRTP